MEQPVSLVSEEPRESARALARELRDVAALLRGGVVQLPADAAKELLGAVSEVADALSGVRR